MRPILPLFALVAFPLAAQQPAAPRAAQPARARSTAPAPRATQVATVEGITEYSLPNGLKILLFPDSSKQTVTVNITYLVGSRHEGYGETGMAHLLEHLVFKGTPRHRNIPQELTQHGARPNGTTWYDRTNYFETFASSDTNLVWALDLEADRMVNSFIARADLESEFSVVRNEFEAGENDPFSVLLERTMSTAFLWHNYGQSTIGARADIENVPIERLQAFYRRYYQPDNAVLLVAGRFDVTRTLRIIEDKFGRIPRPDRSGALRLYPTYTAEPTQDGERAVTLRRVGDVQVVSAVYHVPPGTHEDFPAVEVLGEVLGNEPSGRMYRSLVTPAKAASIGAFAFQLREPGALFLYARVRQEDNLDSARVAMLRSVDSVLAAPPTAEEVERGRNTLLRNIELNLNNSERVGLEISEWASMGDWRMLFLYRDRLRQVTPADVQRVAARYLQPSNRTLGLFLPTTAPVRADIPAAPDVAALVQNYRGDTSRVTGEAFDPSPANIDGRTMRARLPSGLQYAMLPKRTRGQTVVATLRFRYGTPSSMANRVVTADLTADMLMRGTRRLTRQQFRDSLDRLQARVNIFGGQNLASVSIETTRPSLAPVLTLVTEMLKEPAFDTTEFRTLQQENVALIEENKSEPQARGSNAYQRYQNPFPRNDPRYTMTFEEQTAAYSAATIDDVRRFYQDFYGATNAELSVVGDFDTAQVRQQLAGAFGDWRSRSPYERIQTVYRDRPDTMIVIRTPDKANAFFLAGMNLRIRDDSPDYAALTLGNYMLGGGFLNSRLAVRIRQREGISYGVGSQIGASSLDTSGSFTTFAIYAPENVRRLESAFREEVDRMLRDGFTAEEVAQAKAGWLQGRQVTRAQDNALASRLAQNLFLNRTLAFDAELDRQVAALTPDQIVAAMRRHVNPARFVVVEAGDFREQPREAPRP